MDLLHYIENENIEALLISLDFKKCFDTIEFQAIEGVLKFFNFGPYFIKMVLTLYNEFQTLIMHNGFTSNYFFPARGIHQGCAISGYLFILNAEILSMNIKRNNKIKGIPIPGLHEKEVVSQYVDDMHLTSLYDQESLQEIINELNDFYKNTGLRVNYQKSVIYRIGALRNTNKTLNVSEKFRWADSKINILGIILDDVTHKNSYNEIIQKMSTVTKMWSTRNLTLKDKITVANSLMGSLLVYHMQMLPTMDTKDMCKIKKLLEQFIWNGRKPKIRTEILCLDRQQGGMGLFDVQRKDRSVKISWIQHLNMMSENSKALAIYSIQPVIDNADFWYLNVKKEDMYDCCNPVGYWKDVMLAWCEYNFHEVENINQLLQQRIWYNSHIKIGNKIYCHEN